MDTETLSLVCKMLCQHEMALDMLSLHTKISDLVAHALAFVEDYDCETVGEWLWGSRWLDAYVCRQAILRRR